MGDRTTDLKVLDTESESNEIELQNDGLQALLMPTGWEATAGVFFKGKLTPTDTARVIYRNGVAVYIPAGAGLADTLQILDPPIFGLWSVTLCSGAPGAAVNQVGDVTISKRLVRVVV